MKNSKIFYGVLLNAMMAVTAAFAAPSLSINNTSTAAGSPVDVTVSMTADGAAPVSSLQFDMPLPTGFTFVSISTGTATLAASKSVSGSVLSGSVRTLIFGLNQTAIGTGSIAVIRLNTASNLAPGSIPLNLTNVAASNPSGTAVPGTLTTAGSVTILDVASPTTPTGFTAVVVSSTRVNLSWIASTDNVAVTGYRIVRNGVFLTSTTATSFVNSGLTPSTTYSFTVAAFDAAGNISAAASAGAVTLSPPDNTAPTVPSNVAAVAVSSSQINVSWTASTDNVAVTGYQVFRGGVQVSTVTSGTSFANPGLTPVTLYSYTIRAFDAAGNISAASLAASATTLPDRCDLNADGSVNAVDLQNVANAILAGTSPAGYDLNRDTLVNVVDIQLLINVILLTGSCPQ